MSDPNNDSGLQFETVEQCLCGTTLAEGPIWGWGVCPGCGTWVNTRRPTRGVQGVVYGEVYWTKTQEMVSCPPLEQRFKSDMNDRIPAYLRALESWLPAGSRVAEVGCGNARLLHELQGRGHHVTGTEYSQPVIDRVGRLTNVPIRRGGAEQLERGAYDGVVSIDVLEHVHDPAGHLRELAGLLKPSGVLLLHTPVISGPNEPYQYSVGMLWKLYHLYLFSRPLIERIFREAGLAIAAEGPLVFGWPVFVLRKA